MIYLVDTNVISELSRSVPDANVLSWWNEQEEIVVSAVTIEELSFGIERAKENKRALLRQWFESFLEIPPRVLPVDQSIALLAGQLRAKLSTRGIQAGQADALIGATALAAGRILVTRNTKDFSSTAVTTFNPFA